MSFSFKQFLIVPVLVLSVCSAADNSSKSPIDEIKRLKDKQRALIYKGRAAKKKERQADRAADRDEKHKQLRDE
jgi:hypothetical protein